MRIPVSVIVSDLPEELGQGRAMRLAARALTRYDGYLLLTEAMNARVNPKKNPYLVVEGQADLSLATRGNQLAQKRPERVCLYAGMLHARYGILRLVAAFCSMPDPNARLVVFGTGDAKEALMAAAERDSRIEYRGVADNATVVAEEIRATLLVNPRPSDETFTKYTKLQHQIHTFVLVNIGGGGERKQEKHRASFLFLLSSLFSFPIHLLTLLPVLCVCLCRESCACLCPPHTYYCNASFGVFWL